MRIGQKLKRQLGFLMSVLCAVSLVACGTKYADAPALLEPVSGTESYREVSVGDVGNLKIAYGSIVPTEHAVFWTTQVSVAEVLVDVGQESELEGLDERAKYSGAEKLYILDGVDEFCDEYILPGVKANATYEYEYLLGTSFARPLIAKKLVEIARKEGATTICHGATGKGNDQVRFEINIKALAPDLNVIATWRQPEWTMQSREDEIAFCKKHGIDLPFDVTTSYSRDRNIWHISHEGLELEDPSLEPNWDHLLVLGTYPEKAPDEGARFIRSKENK